MNTIAVCIFAFKRIKNLRKLVDDLRKNRLSNRYKFFFFVDRYKKQEDKIKNLMVLSYLKKKKINFQYKLIVRKKNYGLSTNILSGVNYVSKKYPKFIVIEDDLRIKKKTFSFFNKLLINFKNNSNIFTVTGYNLPEKKILSINKNLLFSKRPCSWGWASWSNKWKRIKFNNDYYYKILKNKKICSKIDEYGNDLILMLKKTLEKKIDSWAVKWAVYHIINDKLCVYPKKSFINETGFTENPTNNFFKSSKFFHKRLIGQNILKKNKVLEDSIFKDIIRRKYNFNFIIKFLKKLN